MEIKTAYIILADGFEEIEALGTMDVLRRLHVFVHSVGLDSKTVRGSHHILVEADETFATAKFDEAFAIILPGGLPGATNLRDSARLRDILRKFNTQGKLLCAICAAPTVLAAAGIASGHTVTGYPGCEELAGVPVKFTGVWGMQDIFGVEGLRFSGFIDIWGLDSQFANADDPLHPYETKFSILSEPQLWYNVGHLFGVDNLHVGGEVELSFNFAGNYGFKCLPCIGTKWIF